MARKKKTTQKKTPARQTERESDKESEPEVQAEQESEVEDEPEPEVDEFEGYDFSSQAIWKVFIHIFLTSCIAVPAGYVCFTGLTDFHRMKYPEYRSFLAGCLIFAPFYVICLLLWTGIQCIVQKRNIFYIVYKCMKYYSKRLWNHIVDKWNRRNEPSEKKRPKKPTKLRPLPSSKFSKTINQKKRR